MASNAIVGALQVVLGADTAALDQGLKDAQSSLAQFGAGMSKVGVAAAASFAAVGVAMAAAMKGAIDKADEIGKAAQKIGVPVQELSALKYAADLSDVSMETLTTSMGKLAKNMSAVAGGAQNEAAEAFKAMGIAVTNTDGTLRSSSQVLGDLAGKFAGYEDGAAKSALAMAVFGRAGAQMIPLLNSGSAGLREMAAEAARLGLVMDQETADAAQQVNDNFTRLRRAADGLVILVTARMLPALENLSDMMASAAKNSNFLDQAAKSVGGAIKGVVEAVITGVVVVQRLGVEVGALAKALGEFGSMKWLGKREDLDSMLKAFGDFKREGENTKKVLDDLGSSFGQLWSGATASPGVDWERQASSLDRLSKSVEQYAASWAKVEAPILQAGAAAQAAMSQFFASQAKRIAGMEAEAQTIGLSVGAHEKLRVQLEAEALAKEKNIPLTDALAQKIAATGEAAAMAAMRIQGAQMTMQVMSPAQQFEADMTRLKELYDAGAISMETFAARQKQLAEQSGATWQQFGTNVGSVFTNLAKVFGEKNKEMAVLGKAGAIAQAIINTQLAVTKALASLAPPFSYAAAAASLAQGVAAVAAIKSQSLSGMMTGGALTVRGAGGPDSVPVSFMASPGEQIDVWRPDQGGGADPRRGAGGQTVINVPVPAVTTREAVGELIRHINDALSDGHVLKIRPI
jgi:hypothetical protein